MVRYTSALDRHFKSKQHLMNNGTLCSLRSFLLVLFLIIYHGNCHAELLDRVVAYVEDTAITLSELNSNYEKSKAIMDNISKNDVMDSMINQVLLLREARKMRIDSKDKAALLKDYIDLRIKATIYIKESQTETFYNANQSNFGGKPYLAVKDDIERYLFEKEINERLRSHLNNLRVETEVQINYPLDGF